MNDDVADKDDVELLDLGFQLRFAGPGRWEIRHQFANSLAGIVRTRADVRDWIAQYRRGSTVKFSEMALHVAARCWTDEPTSHLAMDSDLALAFAKRVQGYLDIIEAAWGIIANAQWAGQSDEWLVATKRWRDESWHFTLRNDGDPPMLRFNNRADPTDHPNQPGDVAATVGAALDAASAPEEASPSA